MPACGKKLQVGQTVALEHAKFGCRITVLETGGPGYRVVAVEADHVVLAEASGVTTRIPMYLIATVLLPGEEAPAAAQEDSPTSSPGPEEEAA